MELHPARSDRERPFPRPCSRCFSRGPSPDAPGLLQPGQMGPTDGDPFLQSRPQFHGRLPLEGALTQSQQSTDRFEDPSGAGGPGTAQTTLQHGLQGGPDPAVGTPPGVPGLEPQFRGQDVQHPQGCATRLAHRRSPPGRRKGRRHAIRRQVPGSTTKNSRPHDRPVRPEAGCHPRRHPGREVQDPLRASRRRDARRDACTGIRGRPRFRA